MNAAALLALGALPSFAAGWFMRDLYDLTHKGATMVHRRNIRPLHHLFEWFSHGRRLTGLTVITAAVAFAALGYTFNADQQSEKRDAAARSDVINCIAKYVVVLSKTNLPRTAASVVAADARRDWDRGFSTKLPGLSKDELKDRYLRLYAEYERVREGNPLPTISPDFCGDRQ